MGRLILTIIAFVMIPILWVFMFISHLALNYEYASFKYIFNSWNEHRKSGEAWGVFDE